MRTDINRPDIRLSGYIYEVDALRRARGNVECSSIPANGNGVGPGLPWQCNSANQSKISHVNDIKLIGCCARNKRAGAVWQEGNGARIWSDRILIDDSIIPG